MNDTQKKHCGKVSSRILKTLVWLCAVLTFTVLIFLILFIIIKGAGYLKPSLFAWTYTSENVSLVPAAVNTVLMILITLGIAVPLGVFAAVFLVEYSKKESGLIKIIRMTSETLSGIPSIVYGLFGMMFFSTVLKWGISILSGAFTMVIMILPLIMRTTEEALKSVPDTYREASFGLGAGKLRTIFKIVIPTAVPGILAGVILSTGRIVGETAALIFTAGTVAQIPSSLLGSGRTLAVHMYALSHEALHMNEAYATALILLVVVLLMNGLSHLIAGKFVKA